MEPDIIIVGTYRQSDGLSTIPYGPSTLTFQSANTNDAQGDPPLGPVKWNPSLIRPNIRYAYVSFDVSFLFGGS